MTASTAAVRPTKLRVRYSRKGKIRFISHRDTARVMERAFRTQRLPIAYTEGFSPRPKISFGLALTVAHESEAEYLDLDPAGPYTARGGHQPRRSDIERTVDFVRTIRDAVGNRADLLVALGGGSPAASS